jgi:hypothetical protein
MSPNAIVPVASSTLSGSDVAFLMKLDLDIDPGGQVQLPQRVDGLLSRIQDVEQSLVGPDLELLP